MSKLRRDWLTAPQVLRRPQQQQHHKNFFPQEQRQRQKWQQQSKLPHKESQKNASGTS
jgi:hypothetical protein